MERTQTGETQMLATAYNVNGARICSWEAPVSTIAANMFGDDLKAIDGYAIDGRGIFRASRHESGKLAGFTYMRGPRFELVLSRACLAEIIETGMCRHREPYS